ncbi:MAG: DUF4388 domain-containing protein [Candidatus Zixiibacteriota bacterium]|nr:MAG: DUF4388 domain-containing protein [candidate division Zixibacteria bacterium]
MSFAGNLNTVSLPDVFQLIFTSKMTGGLKITKDKDEKIIYFKGGMLVFATSNDSQDLFGTILVKKGRISREDLNKVIAGQQSGKKIGTLLVEKNLFTREEIIEGLKMQIEEIVYSLFGWKDGLFDFLQDKTPPPDSILSELNPMNIIMEGTRRIDEWEELKKVLPPDSTILELARDPAFKTDEIHLTKNEIILMALIGSGKKLSKIIEDSYLDRFITCKALANLLQQGLLIPAKEVVEEKTVEMEQKALAELLAQIYLGNLNYIFENIKEKLGGKGHKVISETFQINKNYYPNLDKNFIGDDGQIRFDFFLEMYKKLPEEARIWKIVSNFNSLLNDYLNAVNKSLGSKIYKRLLSEIRINIHNIINQNRQISVKYGLEEEFTRILRDR